MRITPRFAWGQQDHLANNQLPTCKQSTLNETINVISAMGGQCSHFALLVCYVIFSTVSKQLMPSNAYAQTNWAISSSTNGLSPCGRQFIIWTDAGLLLIGRLRTNLIETRYYFHRGTSFEKVCKLVAANLSRPKCLDIALYISL